MRYSVVFRVKDTLQVWPLHLSACKVALLSVFGVIVGPHQ